MNANHPFTVARVLVCSAFDGLPLFVSADMPIAEAEALAKVVADPADDTVFVTFELA